MSDYTGWGIPVLSSEGLSVIEAAVAYIDQLSAFNSLTHLEVQRRRVELAGAVDSWHNQPPVDAPSKQEDQIVSTERT